MFKSAITFLTVLVLGLLTACSSSFIPTGIEAVSPFDKDRFLGRWYEIARFDSSFEKDLIDVTAEYGLNEDGTIKVINKGYNVKKEKWSSVSGKAKFVAEDTVGMLKVSFFGPFYGGYNVIAIDAAYQYALVAGQNRNYLWILGRTTELPEKTKSQFLEKAKGAGFEIDNLVWVTHRAVK